MISGVYFVHFCIERHFWGSNWLLVKIVENQTTITKLSLSKSVKALFNYHIIFLQFHSEKFVTHLCVIIFPFFH